MSDSPASSGREIGEELRDIIGIHLAQLAAHYHLDVEDDLATIIAATDDDATDDDWGTATAAELSGLSKVRVR